MRIKHSTPLIEQVRGLSNRCCELGMRAQEVEWGQSAREATREVMNEMLSPFIHWSATDSSD